MQDLIVAWQDPESREWLPVGRLGRVDEGYYFVYTEGAKKSSKFEPFGWMQDITSAYVSKDIFPLFANRLLPKSRPDYKDYMRWLGFSDQEPNDLEVLARSRGVRATDKLEMFPCPAPDERGYYRGYFFCHGLRYLLPENVNRIAQLSIGQQLFVALDVQNPADTNALLLRSPDPVAMVGYFPRYLAVEFRRVIESMPKQFCVHVQQINLDAPYDLRLLCTVEFPWPPGYQSCLTGLYRPLVPIDVELVRAVLRDQKIRLAGT
jgi:hypothetical protein